jgi:hypothetical protein
LHAQTSSQRFAYVLPPPATVYHCLRPLTSYHPSAAKTPEGEVLPISIGAIVAPSCRFSRCISASSSYSVSSAAAAAASSTAAASLSAANHVQCQRLGTGRGKSKKIIRPLPRKNCSCVRVPHFVRSVWHFCTGQIGKACRCRFRNFANISAPIVGPIFGRYVALSKSRPRAPCSRCSCEDADIQAKFKTGTEG